MDKLSIGILAHVDAGKTTLSEAMLYAGGMLKKLGRVDHGDAFLDTETLEQMRGITIFSKQALLQVGNTEITLLDTPGHVDFSDEMERTLHVMDAAILVINASDGVQSHTRTLWNLLQNYKIPTVLFINKMDLPDTNKEALLSELQKSFGDGCLDFSQDINEMAALYSEAAMEEYLTIGKVSDKELQSLIKNQNVYPCYFGCALRTDGVAQFLQDLCRYLAAPQYTAQFGARVYKIAHDASGMRLTYLKITGGSLAVKETVAGEKVNQIRIYSGAKYKVAESVTAGTFCAVTGLSETYAGQGLGFEADAKPASLEPVLTYQVILSERQDAHTVLQALKILEEENPQLQVVFGEQSQEIHLQIMGPVQLEIISHLLQTRFGITILFGAGRILYKETIQAPQVGAGHFEPLRHYAEVHLQLTPLPRGKGLQFDTTCSEDLLSKNWQNLVLTHLAEKQHIGVLTGSPITDMKITLIAGRAHLKHTEGGDFRQATYRALRQGLRRAQSVLLEPYYSFRLEIPVSFVGKAMTDLQQMSATFSQPETISENAVLTGKAPVATMRDYAAQVLSYTKGQGQLSCMPAGYDICYNAQDVIQQINYDCDADVENTADSVFCANGAGYTVKWDAATKVMHVDNGIRTRKEESPKKEFFQRVSTGTLEEEKQLEEIFKRTYKSSGTLFTHKEKTQHAKPLPSEMGPEYLLIDGYNIMFARDELKELARINFDAAREALIQIISNYQGYKKNKVLLVFDAYKVPQGTREITKQDDFYIIYTQEAETADMYIEKISYQMGGHYRVRVATSDRAEQLILIAHDTLRISAGAFWEEIDAIHSEIQEIIAKSNQANNRNMG